MTCSDTPLRADAAFRDSLFCALDRLASPIGPLAVGVSGGSDSTALLLFAAEWASDRGREIVAATVDHGLRPEAEAEAAGVAALCRTIAVRHDTLRWRPAVGSRTSMAAARTARQKLLVSWATGSGARRLALAHTANDRAETFLMRLRAGSGWWGLSGPMPSAPSPAWPAGREVRLIRPLLWAGRHELMALLRARRQPWVDDPTNEAPAYERTRARRLALTLDPSAQAAIVRTMNRFAALRSAQLAGARELMTAAGKISETSAELDVSAWRAASKGVRLRLLESLLVAIGGGSGRIRGPSLATLEFAMSEPSHGRAHRAGTTAFRGATLAGAQVRQRGTRFELRAAPPRRPAASMDTGAEQGRAGQCVFAKERLFGLLGDPCIDELLARSAAPAPGAERVA